MKWLTIQYIKQHSRIDYDCEDALLELYGNAAEETVMNIIRRDYDDIVEHFGTEKCPIPAAIIQASLILVDTSYTAHGHHPPAALHRAIRLRHAHQALYAAGIELRRKDDADVHHRIRCEDSHHGRTAWMN